MNKLNDLRKYSFCKSHAYSYAQLVWRLAYEKAHHPNRFWKSILKHCQSSYKKWVHLYEARIVGVKSIKQKESSIFAKNRAGKYIIVFLRVEKGKYIELKVLLDKIYLTNKVGIKGYGKMMDQVIITTSVDSF